MSIKLDTAINLHSANIYFNRHLFFVLLYTSLCVFLSFSIWYILNIDIYFEIATGSSHFTSDLGRLFKLWIQNLIEVYLFSCKQIFASYSLRRSITFPIGAGKKNAKTFFSSMVLKKFVNFVQIFHQNS